MPSEPGTESRSALRGWQRGLLRGLMWAVGVAAAGAASLAIIIAVALAVAYPNLPDVSDLLDYRPKLPLRVYSSDGVLIAEFGEERNHQRIGFADRRHDHCRRSDHQAAI